MNPALAKKLIENGAIRQGTTFQAYYNAHGLSGYNNSNVLEEFSIKNASILRDTGEVNFVALNETTKELRKFSCRDIVTIDGMDITRIAKTYNLSLTGDKSVSGKRRGRKPKKPIEE